MLQQLESSKTDQLQPSSTSIPNAPAWIQHQAPYTLFLPAKMQKSRQGYLIYQDNKWFFKPGRTLTSKSLAIPLEDFEDHVPHLITSRRLHQDFQNT